MAEWIWYPGDFEIHQGMLQNCVREERGMRWPAYWYMDDCLRNVRLFREYVLTEEEHFQVKICGIGYVRVNDEKHRCGEIITCLPGRNLIEIFVANPDGLPCAWAEGAVIRTGSDWSADDMAGNIESAGTSSLYQNPDQDPNRVTYQEERVPCVSRKKVNGGCLFDFGRAVTGKPHFLRYPSGVQVTVCYGESETEALDVECCYYKEENADEHTDFRRRAFRYLYIPEKEAEQIEMEALHQFIPFPVRGTFICSDEKMNRIWKVSEETFRLCSGLFILDGIKRDQWIWSGDAYQSFFVNRYLFGDEELVQRTLLALRGKDPVKQHMNTIVDYSMLWIASVQTGYEMSGNQEFLEFIYPKVISLLEYCLQQTNELGFLYGREGDWIFVDWADLDKEGCMCAEQVLLAYCLQSVVECAAALGKETHEYEERLRKLRRNIMEYFWDEEKGGFIDSYESGKRHISRQSNLWAVLFDVADENQKASIFRNVICNDAVAPITTPYFKYYELDVLAKMGRLKEVYEKILEYWGGMLDMGAVTFWEEFDPAQTGDEKYGMYGDPYGKSLCHAWGASPIYLIGRYFVGLYPTKPGYQEFAVQPEGIHILEKFSGEFPVKNGSVRISWEKPCLTVSTDVPGGTVILREKRYSLAPGKTLKLEV